MIAIEFDYWIQTDSFRLPHTVDGLHVKHELQYKRVKQLGIT